MTIALNRSIVVVDFVGFTAKNSEQEILHGILGASVMIAAIESFVVTVLTDMEISTEACEVLDPSFPVLKYTGDGLILHFEKPADAVSFGVRLQELAQEHNVKQESLNDPNKELGYRVFRVGIATGLVFPVKLSTMAIIDLAGSVIGDAARIEAACAPGAVLISDRTWEHLDIGSGFSSVFQIDGKQGDGKRYGVHNRQVFERGPEFAKKMPYWRFRPSTESVVNAIENRIRYQMLPLTDAWAINLAGSLGAVCSTSGLIEATKHDPDKVLRKLGRFAQCAALDSRAWIAELTLLTACRMIRFSDIAPIKVAGSDENAGRAYVARLPTTLSIVASICIAGLVGLPILFDAQNGAYTVDFREAGDAPDLHLYAIRQLYLSICGAQAKVSVSAEELLGRIRVHIRDVLDEDKKITPIYVRTPEGDQEKWQKQLDALAEALNHLVSWGSTDNLNLVGLAGVRAGDLQARLQAILTQHFFDQSKP